MRGFLLTVVSVSFASAALAQTSPEKLQASSSVRQTLVEQQAERIRAYQKAMEQEQMKQDQMAAPDGLEDMTIYVGPEKSASESKPEPLNHSVVKGDTLYAISKTYNVDLDALRSANSIEGSAIQLGQSLIIPTTREASNRQVRRIVEPVTPSDVPMSIATPERPRAYAVTPRDTLFAIAKRSCTSTSALIELNALTTPDALKPGQMLELPENHCLER